jgi:menaquinone-dependent protoporphyrinogen oxidase
MTSIQIAYGTREGQTAKIAECLAEVIRRHGCRAHPVDIGRSGEAAIEGWDAVIVGASVHLGKHERAVRDFVRTHRAALERLPSAFFSVSLAANQPTEAARREVDGYIEGFVRETGWRPARIGRFAGALLYTRYGFFTRWIMRRIARTKGSPDLDTSRDYVYTDWEGVRRFAVEFLDALEPARA